MCRLLSLAAFITSVLAAALDTRQAGAGLRTDNYDTLAIVPGAPQLSAVATYNGLDYRGWVAAVSSFNPPISHEPKALSLPLSLSLARQH